MSNAFIHNPDNLPQVNHKDENKTNNKVENLEWCDCKYKINYGTRNLKSSISQGKKVKCIETNIIYESLHEAERHTGIKHSNICNVCNGKLKTAGKYHWQYI